MDTKQLSSVATDLYIGLDVGGTSTDLGGGFGDPLERAPAVVGGADPSRPAPLWPATAPSAGF